MTDEIISLKELSTLIDVEYAKLLYHTKKGTFPDAVLVHGTRWYLPKKYIKLFRENKIDLSSIKRTNKLESDLEKQIVKETKKRGFDLVKLQGAGNKSYPDRIIFLDNGVSFLLELKTEVGSLSAHQKKKRKELKEKGHMYFVIDNIEDYKKVLDQLC